MPAIVRRIRLAAAFLRLMRDPRDTSPVFLMEDLLLEEVDEALFEKETAPIFADAGMSALLAERYAPPPPDVETLSRLAPGTFGHATARLFRDKGFAPDFYPRPEITDKKSYLKSRARGTHDVYHVLTGYDTDLEGEIALQGFTLGQTGLSPTSVCVVCAGLLHLLLRDNQRIRVAVDLFADAYDRGRNARLLFGTKLELQWHRPLDEVRAELGIRAPRPVEGYRYL